MQMGWGMKQSTLATAVFDRYAKTTRRAVFLAEMERVVPWSALCKLIEPFYPKPGNGRPPVGVERMLRLYFLQHWFNLSDPAVEEALYDSQAMRHFVGIDPRLREGRLSVASRRRTRRLCAASAICSRRMIWAGGCSTRCAAPGHQGAEGGHGHDCRRHNHQCTVLDEECREGARSRDAPDKERKPVVLRDEGAFRGRQSQQADPRSPGHAGQCRRQHGAARSVARQRNPRVRVSL